MGKIQRRANDARESRCPFDLVSSIDLFVVMRGSLCQRRQARWLWWRSPHLDDADRFEQLTGTVGGDACDLPPRLGRSRTRDHRRGQRLVSPVHGAIEALVGEEKSFIVRPRAEMRSPAVRRFVGIADAVNRPARVARRGGEESFEGLAKPARSGRASVARDAQRRRTKAVPPLANRRSMSYRSTSHWLNATSGSAWSPRLGDASASIRSTELGTQARRSRCASTLTRCATESRSVSSCRA